MFDTLKSIFKSPPPQIPPPTLPSVTPGYSKIEPAGNPQSAVPVYPPSDGGLAIVPIDKILHSQREYLARIKIAASGLGPQYENLVFPTIRNFANYTGLLPATASAHHRGAGGLFRLGIEVGFASLQAAGGSVFAAKSPTEQRRSHEDRWQVAAFVAGMCAELFRAATDMAVRDSTGRTWPCFEKPLMQWATENNITHVYVTWHEKPVAEEGTRRMVNAVLMRHVMTPELMQWLDIPGTPILPAMLSTMVGVNVFEGATLARVVHTQHKQVVSRDSNLQPAHYGKLLVGSHLEPHLIDAMRSLIRGGNWRINTSEGTLKPRLWLLQTGLYLIWETAAKELIAALRESGVQGVPNEPLSLVEILARAKVLELNAGLLFVNLRLANGKVYEAVKFADEDLVLYGLPELPARSGEVTVVSVPSAPAGKAPLGHNAPQLSLPISEPAIQRPYSMEAPAPNIQHPVDLEPQATATAEPRDTAKRKKKVDAPPINVDAAVDALPEALELLLKGLPRTAETFMRVVLEDWKENRAAKLVIKDKDTYGLSETLLTKYGLRDGTAVSRELADAGWLQLGLQAQRFVNRKIAGVDTDCMLLNAAIAGQIAAAFGNPSGPIQIGDADEGY